MKAYFCPDPEAGRDAMAAVHSPAHLDYPIGPHTWRSVARAAYTALAAAEDFYGRLPTVLVHEGGYMVEALGPGLKAVLAGLRR